MTHEDLPVNSPCRELNWMIWFHLESSSINSHRADFNRASWYIYGSTNCGDMRQLSDSVTIRMLACLNHFTYILLQNLIIKVVQLPLDIIILPDEYK